MSHTDPHRSPLVIHLAATGWQRAASSADCEVWTRGDERVIVQQTTSARPHLSAVPDQPVARPLTPRNHFTIAAHRALGLRPDYTDADLA